MAFIFDHLTAILVGATLLAALLYVQQRTQQQAVSTTEQHALKTKSLALMDMLQRDFENMQNVQRRGQRPAVDGRIIRFHTLKNPGATPAELTAVAYFARETGDSIQVDGVWRDLSTMERYTNDDPTAANPQWTRAGGGASNVIVVRFALYGRDGQLVEDPDLLGSELSRVEVGFLAAEEGVERLAGDQLATTATNLTQHLQSFRPWGYVSADREQWEDDDIPDLSMPLATGNNGGNNGGTNVTSGCLWLVGGEFVNSSDGCSSIPLQLFTPPDSSSCQNNCGTSGGGGVNPF